jgi:hypothetical protein
MKQKKIVLATGADSGYLPKISPYLFSINERSNFDKNFLVYLSEDGNTLNDNPFLRIDIATVHLKDTAMIKDFKCMQHGDFLAAKELDEYTSDEDIIIYTDGDIELGRGLSDEERDTLLCMGDGNVYVGYNASKDDTLLQEAFRLSPTGVKAPGITDDKLQEIPCYNTGVLAMNKATWKRVFEHYKQYYPLVDPVFKHYAKQQWTLSYIFHKENYNVLEMEYSFHNHRCYSSPVGTVQWADGTVMYEDKVVLFKHKWS